MTFCLTSARANLRSVPALGRAFHLQRPVGGPTDFRSSLSCLHRKIPGTLLACQFLNHIMEDLKRLPSFGFRRERVEPFKVVVENIKSAYKGFAHSRAPAVGVYTRQEKHVPKRPIMKSLCMGVTIPQARQGHHINQAVILWRRMERISCEEAGVSIKVKVPILNAGAVATRDKQDVEVVNARTDREFVVR